METDRQKETDRQIDRSRERERINNTGNLSSAYPVVQSVEQYRLNTYM